MKKINIIKLILITLTITSCKHKIVCFREKKTFQNGKFKLIICQKQGDKNTVKAMFRENGKFFGVSSPKDKNSDTKFVFFLDGKNVNGEIDSNYNRNIYYYIAYNQNGTFSSHFAKSFNNSVTFITRESTSLLKDTLKLDLHYKVNSVGPHSIEQYVFIKGKLAKGKYYSIINENKDSVLIKLTYSSMKYSTKNPNMTSIEYFKGDINKYPVKYEKRDNSIYVPDPIKSEAKIKDKHQFWLPKGDKYLVMFYTTKDTSRLLYTKKGFDYVYMDTIPLDYNMFIVDTRQDNSDIVKEFMRKLAFNTSIKYPGKLENRKDIQDMMVKSGFYEYDNNGKLKLVINPLELVKEKKN